MVLAQYSMRSKQSYIYKTNRIREIVGASDLIRLALAPQADGILVRAAAAVHTPIYTDLSVPFSAARPIPAGYFGTVLMEGGGNLTLLFADEDAARTVNRAFTRLLMAEAPGLTPLCVFVPVDFAKDDYRGDYAALMAVAETEKAHMATAAVPVLLPFTQVDRSTFEPIAHKERGADGALELSAASYGKRRRYAAMPGGDGKLLDDLITERGEESLLAVLFIDGNNMGQLVQESLTGTGYEACVNAMRSLSGRIDGVFIKRGFAAIDAKKAELAAALQAAGRGDAIPKLQYRRIVGCGDEITIICNARLALRYVQAYLSIFREEGCKDFSSCAGIAVFHSHYPFAVAYTLAEQACDSAKYYAHAERDGHHCWVDFHYIHGGIGHDLDDIRATQGTAGLMRRPWQLSGTAHPGYELGRLEELAEVLQKAGVTRTNLKTAAAAQELGPTAAQSELKRIYSRHAGLQQALEALFAPDVLPKALYDLGEFYDLWFTGEEVPL